MVASVLGVKGKGSESEGFSRWILVPGQCLTLGCLGSLEFSPGPLEFNIPECKLLVIWPPGDGSWMFMIGTMKSELLTALYKNFQPTIMVSTLSCTFFRNNCCSVTKSFFATVWTVTWQAPLSSTISRSLLKSMSNKGLSSQGCGFSTGHVWIWELDCEESWVPKNWCFWTVVLEKTLERPLDCKEIQPVHSKGDQPWVFIARTDGKAETPILWPPHAKSWLIGKDSDAGRDWRKEEKGMTEDEMAGWHHWLDGRESEWIPGVGDGQGGLACCDSWGRKESDTTERLNWTWAFFGIALSLGLKWELTFSSPVATAEFSKFTGILSAAL